jgi:hypothetical protein
MPLARCLLAAGALLALAPPAAARTTEVGSVAPAGATGAACSPCSYTQIAVATGPSYRVPPGAGVITEWKVRAGPVVNPGDRVRLRVFRPGAAGAGYLLVAESQAEVPQAGRVTAFPAQIAVTGGETVGVQLVSSGNTPAAFATAPGDVVGTWASEPVPGRDAGAPVGTDARRVNAAVRWETDADRDGLGDDTQDSDDDNDGISDDAEAYLHSSPVDRDTDDDGLSDSAEERLGTDPRRADTDGDGLPDGLERGLRRGLPAPPGDVLGTNPLRFRPDLDIRTKTNPLNRDTDRDGLPDGREDRNHNGRRDPGETDPRRTDSDGDGVPDGVDRFPLDRRR